MYVEGCVPCWAPEESRVFYIVATSFKEQEESVTSFHLFFHGNLAMGIYGVAIVQTQRPTIQVHAHLLLLHRPVRQQHAAS